MDAKLTTEERLILLGIAADLARIIAAGQPSGYGFAIEKMRFEDATHGLVRLAGERWLGGVLDGAARMRWTRTLARLEKRGLLERVSMGFGGGTRTTHVALTDTGRELAEKLRAEGAGDV